MKTKKVEIYKVEYTIAQRPNENWVAYVAGFNSTSVQDYVMNYVQGRVIINAMTTISRLDAITNEVRELIARPLLGRKIEKESEKESEETKPVKKKSIVPKG